MPRRFRGLPQFNWAVFGPLIVVFALIVGLSGFVVGLIGSGNGAAQQVTADAHVPGTGGGVDLRPPELVRSQLFSLSARVNGSPTIRRGPGTQYAAVDKLTDGEEVHVIACSPGCDWLRVFSLTDNGQRWVPAAFLTVSGRVDELPVLTPTDPAR